jgi:hypothetical protein
VALLFVQLLNQRVPQRYSRSDTDIIMRILLHDAMPKRTLLKREKVDLNFTDPPRPRRFCGAVATDEDRITLGVQECTGGGFAPLSFIDWRIGEGERVDIFRDADDPRAPGLRRSAPNSPPTISLSPSITPDP